MKAVTRNTYGHPTILSVQTRDIPQPKADEVLIKIKATTVNRTDCGGLLGLPWIFRLFVGFPRPKLKGTGTDFAGIIVGLGSDIQNHKIGDEVFGFYDLGVGSHAEYVCISTKIPMFKKPGNVNFEDAVASCEGAHYAYYFIDKVKLTPGDKVMVYGSTGAIGSAAIQLLKQHKVFVTAVCESAYHPQMLAFGADKVVDYTQKDFTLDELKYDFVFDAVGKSTFGTCSKILKDKGVYISSELGPYWQNPFLAMIAPFKQGKIVKFPFPGDIRRSLGFVRDLLVSGKFKPLIDRKYNIENIREAFDYVLSGQKKGNVIISFND